MIKIFQNLALFRVKNANIFAKFFDENIFKIITSVPDLIFQNTAGGKPVDAGLVRRSPGEEPKRSLRSGTVACNNSQLPIL
jgi:hypothetical protein